MAELVEQRAHFFERQQRRLVTGRPREVADVGDDRPDHLAVAHRAAAHAAGPRADALAGPRVEVGVEHRQVRAVAVLHLVRLHLGVVDGEVRPRHEGEAIELVRDVERALQHAIQLEVRAEHLLVEVVARLAHLLGVVAPVARVELEVPALLVDRRLEVSRLAQRDLARRLPQLVQQAVHARRVLRHVLFEGEVGVALVAEQVGALDAQRGDAGDGLLVVVLVVVIAPARVRLDDLPPQLAVVRVLQERPDARRLERVDPLARHLRGLGGVRARRDDRGRQALQVLLLVDHELVGVGVVQQVLPELDPQLRRLGVDLLQFAPSSPRRGWRPTGRSPCRCPPPAASGPASASTSRASS